MGCMGCVFHWWFGNQSIVHICIRLNGVHTCYTKYHIIVIVAMSFLTFPHILPIEDFSKQLPFTQRYRDHISVSRVLHTCPPPRFKLSLSHSQFLSCWINQRKPKQTISYPTTSFSSLSIHLVRFLWSYPLMLLYFLYSAIQNI